jgi:hypothetical protein
VPEFPQALAVPYDPAMSFAAVIWHYWIGLTFFVLSLLVVAGVIVGYLIKVESLKYPKARR